MAACTAASGGVQTTAPSAPAAAPPATIVRAWEGGPEVPARGRFILVNIPSFELMAFQDGAMALRSRVVVGRPRTPTPEMLSPLYAVKFNPSWTPTPAMMRNEGLRPVPPGPNNPLGRVLFEMENDELVYLHDTNQRQLFARPERAFSHGCVRVEQARPLAAWLLDVAESEIDRMIGRGATFAVPLSAPVTVSLAYVRRAPDAAGRIIEWPDIYNRGPLAQAPAAGSGDGKGCPGADRSG